jgi:hypothetical protein
VPMDVSQFSCPNEACANFGKLNAGNVGTRAAHGKNKDKVLLTAELAVNASA